MCVCNLMCTGHLSMVIAFTVEHTCQSLISSFDHRNRPVCRDDCMRQESTCSILLIGLTRSQLPWPQQLPHQVALLLLLLLLLQLLSKQMLLQLLIEMMMRIGPVAPD